MHKWIRFASVMQLLAAGVFGLATAPRTLAQVEYSVVGALHLETFDKPEGWGLEVMPWVDGVTFPGWHAAYRTGAAGEIHNIPPTILPTTGQGRTTMALYLYRSAAEPADGALGSQPADEVAKPFNVGGVLYGMHIVNQTGWTLTQFTLSYNIELWRLSSNQPAQATMEAFYRVGGSDLISGEWTPIPGSLYTTPKGNEAGSTAVNLNGNDPSNKVRFDHLTVSGIRIPSGQSLWIRWFDLNNRGVDHSIALDDVEFAARR